MKMPKERPWMYWATAVVVIVGFLESALSQQRPRPPDAAIHLDAGERWPLGGTDSYVENGSELLAGLDSVRFYPAKHWAHCERLTGLLIADGGVLSPSIIARAFEATSWKRGGPQTVSVCFNPDGGR